MLALTISADGLQTSADEDDRKPRSAPRCTATEIAHHSFIDQESSRNAPRDLEEINSLAAYDIRPA